jgi:hypothetical protein
MRNARTSRNAAAPRLTKIRLIIGHLPFFSTARFVQTHARIP